MFLFLSTVWASPKPCATLEHLEVLNSPAQFVPRPSGDKEVRDIYGMEHSLTSDNFALHYGDSPAPNLEDLNAILSDFEEAWGFFIVDESYSQPVGTDQYLLNVYIGNSSSNGPPISQAAGYYSTDSEGLPMIVLDPSVAVFHGKMTVAHEFFHAIQLSYPSSEDIGTDDRWYLEATAVWAEGEIYSDELGGLSQIAGFAFYPHYPMNFFGSSMDDYSFFYQYGAGVLFRFLTDEWVASVWMKRSFEEGAFSSPIQWWRDAMAADGLDFDGMFGLFAARNAFWDYDVRDDLGEIVAMTALNYPEHDHHLAISLDGKGTDGWTEAPTETLPQWYGYNHIRLNNPTDFVLNFSFDGDLHGSAGSEARWAVYAVLQQGTGYAYKEIPLEDNMGEISMEGFSAMGSATLSVVAWSDEPIDGETFGYRFSIGQPQLSPGRRCGCTDSKAVLFLFPGLFIYGIRRRS